MNIKHLNQIGDKVIVKKGEGGGGSEGGSSWRYFDVSAIPDNQQLVEFFDFCQYIKVKIGGTLATKQAGTYINGLPSSLTLLCMAVDFAQLVTIQKAGTTSMSIGTVDDVWKNFGISVDAFLSMGAVEITKEEFYTL